MCISILILTTGVAQASVRVTEIAWMGTAESQFGEWFELYNDGSEDVNLAGWKFYEAGGDQLVFTMTKSIPANGYLLVERTTASSPDPVPNINDESGPFGGSGFSNSGENLVLKDIDSISIQSLNFSSGWPAGDSETKKTMQWDGTKWITDVATPKASTKTTGGGGDNPPVETPQSSGSAYVSPKIEPRVQLFIPKTIYSTISAEYISKTFSEDGEIWNGVFLWNMGDGTTYKTIHPETIKHTYKYPGKYTISFGYYKTAYDRAPYLFNSLEKEVLSPKIVFSVIPEKGFQFSNTDSVSIDISGWVIVLDDKTVDLPPLTIIGSKNTILMPFSSFGLNNSYTKASLETPERTKLSLEDKLENKEVVSFVNTRSVPLLPEQDIFESTPASFQSVLGASTSEDQQKPEKNHLKVIIFGVVLVLVILMFVFVDRARVRQEE
jgi:hypothetical protein